MAPFFFVLYCLGLYLEKNKPRISLFLRTLGIFIFVLFVIQWGFTAIQYTPFSMIDAYLLRIDQWLGFNTIALVQWTDSHHWAFTLSNFAYNSLNIEIWFAPLVLALLNEKKQLERFFLYALITGIISYCIYYFFPSTDPSHVLHSALFTSVEKAVYIKYGQMIHHLPLTTGEGGLVSFPSLHVIWAIMVAYAFYNRKYLFYPLLMFNSLIAISTLTTGWHFLTDVLGSFAVASIAIYIIERLLKKGI